jgi:hypothetical protein
MIIPASTRTTIATCIHSQKRGSSRIPVEGRVG